MTFRIADITKPLASVKRICDRDNGVVFDIDSSYIGHKASGHKTPMRHEKGVYLLDVPMADLDEEDFSQQGKYGHLPIP